MPHPASFLTPIERNRPRSGNCQQQECASDTDILPEINHIWPNRIAGHILVMVTNHRRTQRVENKQHRQRAGEKAKHD